MLTIKYRIYPTVEQELKLVTTLNVCRNLYNSCLQLKINTYTTDKSSLSAYDLIKRMHTLAIPNLNEVYSQVLQSVVLRLDTSFKNFFRRIGKGVVTIR